MRVKNKMSAPPSDKKLIVIAGAGSLFVDKTHQNYEHESKKHPAHLKQISYYNLLGINTLKNVDFDWNVISPARHFDYEGPYTGKYIMSEKEEILYKDQHESYLSYDDLTKAIIDLIDSHTYLRKKLTFVTNA